MMGVYLVNLGLRLYHFLLKKNATRVILHNINET
jgi:hypothetical protein